MRAFQRNLCRLALETLECRTVPAGLGLQPDFLFLPCNDTGVPEAAEVDVVANDDSPAGLTVSGFSDGAFGTVERVNADGSVLKYTPGPDFVASDSFKYTAKNAAGEEETQTVEVGYLEVYPVAYSTGPTLEPIGDNPSTWTRTETSTGTGLPPAEQFPGSTDTWTPAETSTAITALYQAMVNRGTDENGLDHWTKALDDGMTFQELARNIRLSTEAVQDDIDSVYDRLLNRPKDQAGAENWQHFLQNGGSMEDFQAAVLASAEYRAANPDDQAIINGFYKLYLHREAEAGVLGSWVDQLNQGRTLQQISSAIKYSQEALYLSVDLAYQSVLGRVGDIGGRDAWAQAMATGLTPDAMWIAMSHSQEHRNSGQSGDALYYSQRTGDFLVLTALQPGASDADANLDAISEFYARMSIANFVSV